MQHVVRSPSNDIGITLTGMSGQESTELDTLQESFVTVPDVRSVRSPVSVSTKVRDSYDS